MHMGQDECVVQVLSFAVKPRALWVAAHHLELTGRMDGLWGALLNAVADLVSGNEAEVDVRRYAQSKLHCRRQEHCSVCCMSCKSCSSCKQQHPYRDSI